MSKIDKIALKAKAAEVKRAHLLLCRKNFGAFASYILKDERTGDPIKPGWIHLEWGRMLRNNDRLAFLAQTRLGKTQQLSVAYALWKIGNNPRIRIAIVSNAETGATKIVRQIQDYIEKSVEFREVFPKIRKGPVWKGNMIQIQRPGSLKDPTVAAFGVDSKSINGCRVDLVLLDDVDNHASTYTELQREKTYQFIITSAMSRLEPDGQAVCIGNAWHKNDLIHRLKKDGWPTYVCPAIISKQVLKQWPHCPYKVGDPLWPEMWSPEALAKKKATTPTREWNRAMLCIPSSEEASFFSISDFEKAKKRGEGYREIHSIKDLLFESGLTPEEVEEELNPLTASEEGPGIRVIHGVDLSTGRSSDQSAIVSIACYPDGTRRVLRVVAGHWKGQEIVDRLISTYSQYGGMFAVEGVSMQISVIDMIRGQAAIPIYPYNTHKHGKVVGFSAISAEFTAGMWVVPSVDGKAPKEIEGMLMGLADFNPNTHTDDRSMALLFAVTFLRFLESYERNHGTEDEEANISVTVLG